MGKQQNIELEGEVTSELGNSMFRVLLNNGQEILCTICGKIRKNYIRILVGDKVRIEVSPYDLSRGRIITRIDNNMTVDNNNVKLKTKKKK